MKHEGSMSEKQKARHPEDSGPATNHTADRYGQCYKTLKKNSLQYLYVGKLLFTFVFNRTAL